MPERLRDSFAFTTWEPRRARRKSVSIRATFTGLLERLGQSRMQELFRRAPWLDSELSLLCELFGVKPFTPRCIPRQSPNRSWCETQAVILLREIRLYRQDLAKLVWVAPEPVVPLTEEQPKTSAEKTSERPAPPRPMPVPEMSYPEPVTPAQVQLTQPLGRRAKRPRG